MRVKCLVLRRRDTPFAGRLRQVNGHGRSYSEADDVSSGEWLRLVMGCDPSRGLSDMRTGSAINLHFVVFHFIWFVMGCIARESVC